MRYPRPVAYTIALFFAILVGGGLWSLVLIQRAAARDAARLSDMQYLATLLTQIRLSTNSYRALASVNGCTTDHMAVNRCDFSILGIDRLTLRDPDGSAYVMTRTPDDTSFEMSFELERSYPGLPKGIHTFGPSGID